MRPSREFSALALLPSSLALTFSSTSIHPFTMQSITSSTSTSYQTQTATATATPAAVVIPLILHRKPKRGTETRTSKPKHHVEWSSDVVEINENSGKRKS